MFARNYGMLTETKLPLPLTPSHQGRGKTGVNFYKIFPRHFAGYAVPLLLRPHWPYAGDSAPMHIYLWRPTTILGSLRTNRFQGRGTESGTPPGGAG